MLGLSNYVIFYVYSERSFVFNEITPELSQILFDAYMSRPSAATNTIMACLAWNGKGKAQEIDPKSSSFSPRSRAASFWIILLTTYDGTIEAEQQCREWQDGFRTKVRPYVSACVVNTIGQQQELAEDIYNVNLEKLQTLKTRYDPHNFFKFNNGVITTR